MVGIVQNMVNDIFSMYYVQLLLHQRNFRNEQKDPDDNPTLVPILGRYIDLCNISIIVSLNASSLEVQ